jgi:hypothetical protein
MTASCTAIDRGYTSSNRNWDNALDNNRNYFWVLDSFYQSNAALFEVGAEVQSDSGNYYPAGTTITSVSTYTYGTRSQGNVRLIFTSSNPTQDVFNVNVPLTITKTFKGAPTNNIYFQKAAYESAEVVEGTTVSDSRFPAGTQVSTVQLKSYGGTEYYDVVFNQPSDGTAITAGTTTIEFEFVNPPYAQPGETIFSFIAQPGERSTLDLSFIKELTNTTLGGRGTFPNGPDVLAINVFKTSGAAINSNVVLRWSEAQA